MLKFSFDKSRFIITPLAAALLFAAPPSYSAAADGQTFLPLLDMTVARLHIARQVALSKWDSHKPVEDLPREAEVIKAAAEEARSRGVPPQLATHFFADQIEANKLVQYGLLAQWRRDGRAPDDKRVDLKKDIRPELDRLQQGFIKSLADTKTLRAQPDCSAQLARATQDYVASHTLEPLYAIAMDRALARVCEPE
ncbi:chorismate mutase [Paraburkholderia rhizosphaerae]|uniref:Chorismate mutase n=1 Tax=Paraburkholderia rhizosphaerae TaxID=480658 RepID=A0A4R8LEA5_9BURK|nr:chorismate mutase [Paraburkholderia rhizosphaerae]TDY40450.1 chorismate mutase [Paraburkholderia rhizosphaerae]